MINYADYADICYKKLGISSNSTPEEIEQAFRNALIELYPGILDDNKWEATLREIFLLLFYYNYLQDIEQRKKLNTMKKSINYLSGYIEGFISQLLREHGIEIRED